MGWLKRKKDERNEVQKLQDELYEKKKWPSDIFDVASRSTLCRDCGMEIDRALLKQHTERHRIHDLKVHQAMLERQTLLMDVGVTTAEADEVMEGILSSLEPEPDRTDEEIVAGLLEIKDDL